jgi:hypothetical protein
MASLLHRLLPATLRRPGFADLAFAVGAPARVGDQSATLGEKGSIAFLLPGMVVGSGGHTSILRLGTWLASFGHEVTYVSYDGRTLDKLERRAGVNLPGWQGRMMTWRTFLARRPRFDVGVATQWDSCYHLLRHQALFGRKAYFIQDYEPFFFPRGDLQLMAEQTYGMGLHHLSLGGWNLERVRSELGIGGGDLVDFPVELRQFPLVRRPLRHGETLRLAVYTKSDGKRAPALLAVMLRVVAEAFRARGVAAEFRIFGMRSARAVFPVGENLGKLRTPAIKALYAWADLGVVASLTNISLVNYEMLACGLPVVDLRGGSAPFFFDDSEMLFARPHPDGLAELLDGVWGREDDLAAMVGRAQDKIRDRQWTWEQASRQFEAALRRPFQAAPPVTPRRPGGAPGPAAPPSGHGAAAPAGWSR